MYLKRLSLENFRSYEKLELDFLDNVNVFYGDNAEGKTNILESIYLSAITKSYRATKDIECIKIGNEFFRIYNEFLDNNENNISVEIFMDNKSKKQIKENDVKINKYSDFIGRIPIVMFSPENMDVVKGSPKNRRKFIDVLISQISKKYVISLQEYNKLIQLKNNILKQDKNLIDFNYLDIIDEQIAKKAEYISTKRLEYVDKVEKQAQKIQKLISKGEEELSLKYISDFINKSSDQIKEILKNSRDNDIFRKISSKSLGHDDINIFVNDLQVDIYGSQGQNRTALLSLKLAEFEILKEEKDNTPIILLDDVFSELDKERINFLIEYVSNYQVFITTTEIDSIKSLNNKSIFKVKNSSVEKIKN